jgi:hypothetical protein
MKQLQHFALAAGILVLTTSSLTFCKSKPKTETETPATTSPAPDTLQTTQPVEISSDSALQKGANDAIKDFPGVTATVSHGEISLTGTIKRSDLPTLMQSLNSLHPSRINNNLSIK